MYGLISVKALDHQRRRVSENASPEAALPFGATIAGPMKGTKG